MTPNLTVFPFTANLLTNIIRSRTHSPCSKENWDGLNNPNITGIDSSLDRSSQTPTITIASSQSPCHPHPRRKRCPSPPSRCCYSQSPMVGCPACTEPFLIALSNLRRLQENCPGSIPSSSTKYHCWSGAGGDCNMEGMETQVLENANGEKWCKHEIEGDDITYLDHCNGMN